MTQSLHAALTIAVMSLVTIGLRFLPFWVFGGKKKIPDTVLYLGRVLPNAAMGLLVVYCLRNLRFTGPAYGIPELLSCAVVAAVQLGKKNTILSIVAGTACYMLLIRI